jgi:hypothetical protein
MFFDVRHAELVADRILRLQFEDGLSGRVDLSKYVQEDTVFARLKNTDYFKAFRIEFGTLVWGDGELDIAPEALYQEATGKEVIYRSKDSAVS